MIGTAVAVLVTAGVAVAALNSYTASFKFSPTKAGTSKKQVPVGFSMTLTAASASPGNRAAPLKDIKTWIYGLQANNKDFATCSLAKIAAAKNDAGCPKAALVAEGPVNAILGSGQTGAGGGSACNPYLHVWNSGPGKLTYFFVIFGKYQCAGLHTGASAPYPGFVSQQGKYLVQNVPLPPDVSTNAGGIGLYAALIKETLAWKKLTATVHGKTIGFQSSFACVGNKRPYKVQFTAQKFALSPGPQTETVTVRGTTACSK
jgi:hypothetical protein